MENKKIKKGDGVRIYFPYQIMIDLTKEVIVNNVVKDINKIFNNVDPTIKSIIFTGSVSDNDFIFSMLKEEIKTNYSNIECYRSPFTSTAIVRGAVIFGFSPSFIKTRVSKYTIGIGVSEEWDESKHGERQDLKYYDEDEKRHYCYNVFSPLIYQKEKIGVDEKKSKNYDLKKSSASIRFYKTIFNDVKFVDEKTISSQSKKCIKLFDTIFDVGDRYDEKDHDLVVQLQLGGTFVNGNIIYKKINTPVEFNFSNE